MRLEEAIQQAKFNSEHQKAAVNIIYTYFWTKEQMSKQTSPFGITIQQYNVLRILKGQLPNGITTSDIRSRMLDKMSDASRLVDRLEKRKLVSKKVNPDDRRLVVVKITESGVELLEQMKLGQETANAIAKNLSDEEAAQLNELLDKARG